MKNTILFTLLSLFSFASFAQSNQVKLVFDHQADGQPLELGTTNFEIWNGKKTMLDRAQFYISEISLVDENDVETTLTDVYVLVDANKIAHTYELGDWDVNSVKTVKLHVGVDAAHNHLDPAIYSAPNPLALQNPSMHWGWSAGYRFMAIEGEVDNNNDDTVETMFQYHNLGDDLYFGTELSGLAIAENGELVIHVTLDYAKLFDNLTLSGNVIQHGSAQQNQLMLENAVNNGFMVMESLSANEEILANSATIQANPNPADLETQLFYDFETSAKTISVTVTSMAGQSLLHVKTLQANGAYTLNTSRFPAGVYQVVFHEGNNLIARKQIQVVH